MKFPQAAVSANCSLLAIVLPQTPVGAKFSAFKVSQGVKRALGYSFPYWWSLHGFLIGPLLVEGQQLLFIGYVNWSITH